MTPNTHTPKETSFTDRKILRNAIIDSFSKLDPRLIIKNPVMFVVEVGAVITLIVLISNLIHRHRRFLVWTSDHALALVHRALC